MNAAVAGGWASGVSLDDCKGAVGKGRFCGTAIFAASVVGLVSKKRLKGRRLGSFHLKQSTWNGQVKNRCLEMTTESYAL